MDPKKLVQKLESDNKFYTRELAKVQKEYVKLIKKHKRLQKDLKKAEDERDRLARLLRQKDTTPRRGLRGWPIK